MKRLSAICAAALWCTALWAAPRTGGELRLCLRSDPKTLDPFLVADEASETVRYLTGGVLIRVKRTSQQLEPQLAESWKISEQGRRIVFELRQNVLFSDGSKFSADDVAFTMRRLLDPKLHSPTGDAFRSGTGEIQTEVMGPYRIAVRFPAAVAGVERLFDQVAIVSSRSPGDAKVVLGPFQLEERQAGVYLKLKRNPNYWRKDRDGRRLPYLDSIRLEIQQNREIEMARFRRGELHAVPAIDSELFERLPRDSTVVAIDAGPSYEPEMLWFNQVKGSPIPAYKKEWFRSVEFRRAISESIQREDICRLVYRNHAAPAAGPVPKANAVWFNRKLKPVSFDPKAALGRLQRAGFRMSGEVLQDPEGHAVEFSIVTNSGNRARVRIAAMIQQDLGRLGIRVNLVPLDFPSLIERITKSYQYEACLLGLVNVDPDPNGEMNVWLSSASQHQWNPNQKSPETPWEAEIDQHMRTQASSTEFQKRKQAYDRVQEIVAEQLPFIYLIEKNYLAALSPVLRNVEPAPLRPQLLWNAEQLYLESR